MPRSQTPQSSQRVSQASQRLSQMALEPVGTPGTSRTPGYSAEMQELARAAVRYLLMNDFDKIPIKHNDIVKNVTKNISKNTSQVIQLAARMLKEVYGLKLVEDGSKSNKQYFLVNDMKMQEHVSLTSAVHSDLTLLAVILSLIFMMTNGRLDAGLEQAKVYSFLKSLDIDVNDYHEYFGDVKKTLKNFLDQRYLDQVRIENTDPAKYEYRWGIRACEELSPREALKFADEMYGRDRIESWKAQYDAVVDYEKKTGSLYFLSRRD